MKLFNKKQLDVYCREIFIEYGIYGIEKDIEKTITLLGFYETVLARYDNVFLYKKRMTQVLKALLKFKDEYMINVDSDSEIEDPHPLIKSKLLQYHKNRLQNCQF